MTTDGIVIDIARFTAIVGTAAISHLNKHVNFSKTALASITGATTEGQKHAHVFVKVKMEISFCLRACNARQYCYDYQGVKSC